MGLQKEDQKRVNIKKLLFSAALNCFASTSFPDEGE